MVGRERQRVREHGPWYGFMTPTVGKIVRRLARTRGGGTAFPGKVVERIDPGFLSRTLARLPYGVVLVSGTNGKTTTTRMVSMMLERCGFKVFTNPTGSNFTRGVVSALLGAVDAAGRLDADIAVLELDEAYAVHFVRQVRPRYALLLNVMRDQLDRFGEIDNTARLLGHVAEAATGTVVLNREDPRVAALAGSVADGVEVRYFGLDDALRAQFPSDDDMRTTVEKRSGAPAVADGERVRDEMAVADVTLTRVGDHHATFLFDGRTWATDVRLEGLYNLFNAAAALALVRSVIRDAAKDDPRFARIGGEELIDAVSCVTPAFGRGETIMLGGAPIELVLVKNPMGFRLALASFDPHGRRTMIVINDEYADGRDMSWLWDVDFTSLRDDGVAEVSGVRAWDMALRLGYDQVPVGAVRTDIDEAVDAFIAADPKVPKRIYCTYTAMLAVRSHLASITDVEDVGL